MVIQNRKWKKERKHNCEKKENIQNKTLRRRQKTTQTAEDRGYLHICY